jgi:hypothetical protein
MLSYEERDGLKRLIDDARRVQLRGPRRLPMKASDACGQAFEVAIPPGGRTRPSKLARLTRYCSALCRSKGSRANGASRRFLEGGERVQETQAAVIRRETTPMRERSGSSTIVVVVSLRRICNPEVTGSIPVTLHSHGSVRDRRPPTAGTVGASHVSAHLPTWTKTTPPLSSRSRRCTSPPLSSLV